MCCRMNRTKSMTNAVVKRAFCIGDVRSLQKLSTGNHIEFEISTTLIAWIHFLSRSGWPQGRVATRSRDYVRNQMPRSVKPLNPINLVPTHNPKYHSHSCQQVEELMASAQSVKIIARLRPPIPGELSDDGIRIIPTDEGLPAISVNNPRDHSQVFKFP
jgi:hypothetical protein